MAKEDKKLEDKYINALGEAFGAAAYSDGIKSASSKAQSIAVGKALIKRAYRLFELVEKTFVDSSSEDYGPVKNLLKTAASVSDEDWSEVHDGLVLTIAEAISSEVKVAAANPYFAGAGALGKVTASGLAGTGRVGAGVADTFGAVVADLSGAESIEAEKLKAAILKYKLLTSRLNREIAERYLKANKDKLSVE